MNLHKALVLVGTGMVLAAIVFGVGIAALYRTDGHPTRCTTVDVGLPQRAPHLSTPAPDCAP